MQLIAYGADVEVADEYGWRALHLAAFHGDALTVQRLVNEGGADVNATTKRWAFDNIKPSGLYTFSMSLWEGTTLHISTLLGQLEITRCLLRHGANVDAPTDCGSDLHFPLYGPTALRIAVGTGSSYGLPSNLGRERLQIARVLIEHGASPHKVADHLTWEAVHARFEGFEDVWKYVKSTPNALETKEENLKEANDS